MISNLPDIYFVDTSVADVENYIIEAYQEKTGRILAKGDPVRLLLLSIAAMIAHERVLMDQSAKQNLLAYATGNFLDHIGLLVDTIRLPATAAKTTLLFTVSSAQNHPLTIPSGTKVSSGNDITFATTEDAIILTGSTSIEVAAESTTPGASGNNFPPGSINQIVDPFPWFQSVTNLTTSEGGADTEADNAFRQRIRQAPERFSTAGPEGAYEYWSKSASQEIIDVAIYSPQEGVVEICPLLTGGQIPGQEILDEVLEICSDKKRRPLTDKVQVVAPKIVDYNLDLTFYIYKEDIPLKGYIKNKVDTAIEEYVLWQRSKIGQDINPSELIKRIKDAGAKRVEVREPAFRQLLVPEIAVLHASNIVYGGEEDA